MECPICQTLLQQLFTSTYCPTCEEAEKTKTFSEVKSDEVEPMYTVNYTWRIRFKV